MLKKPNIKFDGKFFTTANSQPRIGDIRVSISTKQPYKQASIMGKVINADASLFTFDMYKDEKCNGKGFLEIEGSSGQPIQKDVLIQQSQDSADFSKWLLRIGAFLLIWFGLHLIAAPIAVIPEFIPCIGGFISDLVGCMLCCFTCLCASVVFMVIFAVSWVYFRPVLGIGLLVASGVVLAGLIFWRVRAKKANEDKGMQI